jgi:hypothetical protein
MPARRLLGTAALAATLLTLTSCQAHGSTTAGASPSPSSSPTASPATASAEPSDDCGTGDIPAGHQMVELVNPPAQFIVQAKPATFSCDPNGGGYAGTGTAKDYTFATDVAAKLNTGATGLSTVTYAELTAHVRACLNNTGVKSPYSCSGNIYDIVLSPSGTVSEISEVWHS